MSKVLKVNITRKQDGELVEVLVPGYKKEEVTVTLEPDKLTLRDGVMLLAIKASNEARGLSENWVAVDTRLFDVSSIPATFSDCILSIELKFKSEYKGKTIEIT